MHQSPLNNLSDLLKNLRLQNHYTQAYIADKLGISRQGYCHYEYGHAIPNTDSLLILSELYNIPIESFMKQTPQQNIPQNSSKHELYQELKHTLLFEPDFLHYFSNIENQKKYHALNRIEKELLFFFQRLTKEEQIELLLNIFIKELGKSQAATR